LPFTISTKSVIKPHRTQEQDGSETKRVRRYAHDELIIIHRINDPDAGYGDEDDDFNDDKSLLEKTKKIYSQTATSTEIPYHFCVLQGFIVT
jgi:hypothetical protein